MQNPTAVQSANVTIDGQKLRQVRKLRGLTGVALAEKAGISFGYLGQIERGVRLNVGPPVFIRLCDALGLTEDRRETLIRQDAA
jgi:transcriptional regulator with XRE-family HTH domain